MVEQRKDDIDLYAVLEVSKNATQQEIEDAHKRIMGYLGANSMAMYAMQPDVDLDQQRDDVALAHHILTDAQLRDRYDCEGIIADVNVHVEHPAVTELKTNPIAQQKVTAEIQKVVPQRTPQEAMVLKPSLDLPKIGEDTEVSGAMFQCLRESAGASIDDVAKITKVSKRYLRAIEENDFQALPAAVYVRGFVSSYAQVMGMDPKPITRAFMCLYKRYTDGKDL